MNSMITNHLAIKAAVQRIEAALARQTEAEQQYQRTGLASKKDSIESAIVARRNAYHELRNAADELIKGGV